MDNSQISILSGKIDHTLLRPDSTITQIEQLCREAEQHQFAAICIAPCWLNYVDQWLKTPTIERATVISFPHGDSYLVEKSSSGNSYCNMGATELDIVANIGLIKSGEWQSTKNEIELIGKLREFRKGLVKIKYIVEVGYLTDDELFKVADILIENKIDYIKTCTGYGPRGVTVNDILKIKKHVGNAIKIKASGGIKTSEDFLAMINAGADRVGTSSSVKILEEISSERA
jgi:deoxyribose-phosphate aldolase